MFLHCHKYIIIHYILRFLDLFSLHHCLNDSCLNMEPMKQFHELGMVSSFFPRESCRYILPHQTLGGNDPWWVCGGTLSSLFLRDGKIQL